MKKKLYLLPMMLLLSFCVFAKDVDRIYAMQVAKNFYLQNNAEVASVNLTLVYECKTAEGVGRISDGKPVYYVFDINNNGGFVVVAGDDLVQPVLAYSTEGHYTKDDMAAGTIKWMDNYRKQIVYVKENVHETTDVVTRMWSDYYNNNAPVHAGSRANQAVSPLCATKWNQAPHENGMAPFDNASGSRCVTGCVATAMAQVMKFYNYPTQGTGFHSYNNQKYGTLSANFGSTTYQWNQMGNVLSSANSAVATLMFHCGVSVDMGYGPASTGGSVAYVIINQSPIQACAEYAYKTYFGYDPATLQGVQRQNYTEANWKNLLKTELNASRPIQYAGFGNGGGHTWVCDGFDQNDFFHMNWGWGGSSDGYFSVNDLDPTALGAGGGTGGFNSGQQAVIGIKPLNNGGGGGGTINQDGLKLFAATNVSANPFQSGGNFSVFADIANTGTSDFSGSYAAAIFTNDGVFVQYIQEFNSQTLQAGFHVQLTFTANGLDLIPGTYIIGVFFKNGANNYSLVDPNTFVNPANIVVTGPSNTIQMHSATTTTPAIPIAHQAFTVDTKIANAGGSTFSGWFSADLFDSESNYVANIEELSGSLQSGFFADAQFVTNGINAEPGTYYIAFFSSPDSANWTLIYNINHPNPVKITITEQPISPDVYESNNTSSAPFTLTANFSGNNTSASTPGANNHVGNDYDYYKINLPQGTNYSITGRVHDSYNSGNGQTYTNDVQVSYSVNGGAWSDAHDDLLGEPVFVQNGGNVIFFVSDYFSGSVGTYLLDLQIVKGPNVDIEEVQNDKLSIFPNPSRNTIFVDAGNVTGDYTLSVFNTVGELALNTSGAIGQQLVQTDISSLASGVYTVQLRTAKGISTSKLIVQ